MSVLVNFTTNESKVVFKISCYTVFKLNVGSGNSSASSGGPNRKHIAHQAHFYVHIRT